MYAQLAQQYMSGGGAGAAAAGAGGGGNSSSLKASQDSTFGFNNNADFTVGSNKSSNTALYIGGAVVALGIIAYFFKK